MSLRRARNWSCGLIGFALSLFGAPALAAPRTVNFWAVTSNIDDVEMYRGLADAFQRQTGIHVEVTPLAWGSFNTKYFAAMAAGLPPDIGITNLGGPYDYGTVGGVVDLRAQFPDRIGQLEGEFNPGLLPGFMSGKKLFAMPSDATTLLMYFRTDIFRKLGLAPPRTWSEMHRVIGVLEASGYQFYFGWIPGAQWAIKLFTAPYGLPGIRRDANGKPALDWLNPKYQKGVMEALNLWYMHNSPGRDLGSRALGMFANDDPGNSIPLMFDLPTNFVQLHNTHPEIDGKWAVAPWPKADDGNSYDIIGGTAYVIFRQSKVKEEAFQWLLYLNSLPVQREMALNHMSRGEDSDFMASTVRSMWTGDNDSFWANPKLASAEMLRGVLARIMPTLTLDQNVHGSTEVGTLEADLLDETSSLIQEEMGSAAGKLGISRSQFVQGFGAGKYTAQWQAIFEKARSHLAAGYQTITPEALDILNKSEGEYQSHFGNVIQNLDAAERAPDALKVAKVCASILIVFLIGLVASFRRYRKHLISYLFVAPPMLLALVFVFVPAAVALYLSFTMYHPVLPLSTASWVGVSNYADIVHSGDLAGSLGKTLYYTAITVPAGVLIALVFAYLLNGNLRGPKFWRFIYFSPMVTSLVSIALIFSQLFLDAKQGWLNDLLLRLGLVKDPVQFLTSEHTFLKCVIVLAIWQGLAFTILVFLAGLQQVPLELFEAAAVDGAGSTRRFWSIAVPGIRPQVFFITILGFIGGLQVFETIYTMANKSGDAAARFGPNDSGLTVVPLIYHYGFETFEMGKAAAVAYVLFVLILIVTAIQLRVFRRGEA